MHYSNLFYLAVASTIFSSVSGHMLLSNPTPFDKSSSDNGPLHASGDDFPCAKRTGKPLSPEGAANTMAVGQNYSLSFRGSAVHGGGSCQLSLTSDKMPTPQSKWMVIHSIYGCPVRSTPAGGNLPSNANGDGSDKYEFTVPNGLASGDYTFAWTWFNMIGNSEMYMNCAPVTITGGSSSTTTNFPDLFKANIGSLGSGCTENTNDHIVDFPDPGTSVEYASSLPRRRVGSCGGGGGTAGSVGGSGAPVSAPPVLPTTTSTAAAASSTAVVSPVSSPAAQGSPVASPQASPSSGGVTPLTGGATAPNSMACPSPGTEVCSPDGTMIGMCDLNSKAVMMPVAAGTKCSSGQMVAARAVKRDTFRFARGHSRRAHA